MIPNVQIPEGSRGPWTVKRYTVDERASKMTVLQSMMHGRGYVPPGTYTELRHAKRGLIMSDTPDEMRDHYEFVHKAMGQVLINGLGLGMALAAILKKPEVKGVTVIEIDPDVIALVGPAFAGERVAIIHADAFLFQPPKGERYNAVWHDIWDDICGDNLAPMTQLKKKYGRRTDWQGCWCEHQTRRGR